MRRLAFFTAFSVICAGSSGAAHAGDKPLVQPVPAWVKPAPAIDATTLTDASPVLLIVQNQQRLQDGEVWAYGETATRAASPQIVSAIGTIQIPWQPAQGDLIIHKVEIIRGAEHIDLMKGGQPFTVLRREEQLSQRQLDGRLTATLPVEGLAVGDVLHMAFSITRKDPTLRGDLQAFAGLAFDPVRIQNGQVRLIWPVKSDVRWKSYVTGITAKPVTVGDYRELTVPLPLPKQPEMPSDAPQRFQKLPILEATTFTDWAGVSKVMAPLYVTDGLIGPGSPLAAEVDRIVKATADPTARAAMALQLVQDKIRYLLLGMDTGNYVPQPPALTWSARYGDCKAKTLLLLALLHAMQIEAEPVLANSKLGDLLPERLPGAGAFDHVFVRATIAGESLWLDGTASGARLADIHDTPPLGNVLPLRAAGATLLPIAMHADARPDIATTIELDESAGANLPTPFKAVIVLRGPIAESTRLAAAQGSKDELDKYAVNLAKSYVDDPAIVTRSFAFDEATATSTVSVTGLAYPGWTTESRRMKSALDRTVTGIDFKPDRARALWQAIPVKTGDAEHYHTVTRVKLPAGGAGFTIEGDRMLAATLAGTRIDRTVSQAGEWITIDEKSVTTGAEIAAADIPAERQKVSAATSHLPRIVAPADYPPEWRLVVAGKKAKAFDAILALYAKRIASDPDDRERYTDRAWFLERIYERKLAIADLDRALALESDADTYLRRAALYEALGDTAKALADAEAALKTDPSSADAIGRVASLKADGGDNKAALAMIQERIDAGGKEAADYMASKAEFEARDGNKEGAIATIDAAVADKPGNPSLLNSRCWIKGTANVALDTALKDCTKSIELSESTTAALDSRAMVYYRLGRFDDALADLDAALDASPNQAASLYMRGIVRRKLGKASEGDADLAGARVIAPQIDKTYGRFGIVP